MRVPIPAQDRVRRGPLAALLIFLSLFLASGTAAATGGDLRGPASRLGSSRQGAATALLPSGTRNTVEDEASADGPGPAPLPSVPAVVTGPVWARPSADGLSAASVEVPYPASASYRARAPPAS